MMDSGIARLASMIETHSQDTAGHVDKAVQALGATLTERLDQVDSSAVQAQQDQAKALGALLELIEAQAGQLTELRRELQAERERRGWWARLFGSLERGGDR